MKTTASLLRQLRERVRPLAVLAMTVAILTSLAQPASAGIYSIRILPSVTQVNTGATFTVVLQANMVVDQYATGLIRGALTYPQDLVQVQSVVVNEYPEVTYSTSVPGQIIVSSPDKGAGHGYGSQLKIITVTFKAIAGGSATFSANNGTTNGVMVVNGTNHVVVNGVVTTVGCAPGATGTYPNCTTPTPTPKPTPTPTATPRTTVTASPAASRTPTPTPTGSVAGGVQTAAKQYGQQADDQLTACLNDTTIDAAYVARLKTQARLTYNDLSKTQTCFTPRKSVVPVNLAPVEPSKVKELPVKDSVKVDKVDQVTKDNAKALKLTGTAAPNQTVVIYMFSDPLVLVAKANQNGSWTYELQDPMEPGKHEAFVTVEGESRTEPAVRSAGINFAIVAAPKTTLNPSGLSLELEQTSASKNFYSLYIAGAVLVILVALGTSLWFIRRRSQVPPISPANPPTGPTVSGSGV